MQGGQKEVVLASCDPLGRRCRFSLGIEFSIPYIYIYIYIYEYMTQAFSTHTTHQGQGFHRLVCQPPSVGWSSSRGLGLGWVINQTPVKYNFDVTVLH
jgi:hypothetical protein